MYSFSCISKHRVVDCEVLNLYILIEKYIESMKHLGQRNLDLALATGIQNLNPKKNFC